jgi:hypothetical protein
MYWGPSSSRPASVVTSFIVEAGFISRLSLWASASPLPPSGTTLTPTVGGTPAAFRPTTGSGRTLGRGFVRSRA